MGSSPRAPPGFGGVEWPQASESWPHRLAAAAPLYYPVGYSVIVALIHKLKTLFNESGSQQRPWAFALTGQITPDQGAARAADSNYTSNNELLQICSSQVNRTIIPRAGADMMCNSDPTAVRATIDRTGAFPTKDLGKLELVTRSLQTEVIQQSFTVHSPLHCRPITEHSSILNVRYMYRTGAVVPEFYFCVNQQRTHARARALKGR